MVADAMPHDLLAERDRDVVKDEDEVQVFCDRDVALDNLPERLVDLAGEVRRRSGQLPQLRRRPQWVVGPAGLPE
jgi:3-methyladenine DNA glycosylase/8-oxoguanine DNA glycosylase